MQTVQRSAYVEVSLPIQRMTWQEAMDRFGSDKPDIRFGMELNDVTDVVRDCEFVVFKNAIENGGTVRGINAKGQGGMPRKKIDKLVAFAKDYGAKGLVHCKSRKMVQSSHHLPNLATDEQMKASDRCDGRENGDLLLLRQIRIKSWGSTSRTSLNWLHRWIC